MTDAELLARLRLYGSKFHHEFGHNEAAADRIEALTAKVKLMDDLDAINVEKIEALEAKLAKAEAEAKKYKHAFAAQSRKLQAVLHIEGVKATLAEISSHNKGESHE